MIITIVVALAAACIGTVAMLLLGRSWLLAGLAPKVAAASRDELDAQVPAKPAASALEPAGQAAAGTTAATTATTATAATGDLEADPAADASAASAAESDAMLQAQLESLRAQRQRLDRLEAEQRREEERQQRQGELLQARLDEAERRLESISGLSAEAAKAELVGQLEGVARRQAAAKISVVVEAARDRAASEAAALLATAAQRLAGEFVTSSTVTSVALPNDELKGRIIGREGRNIRVFEQATGVDVIVDDTPEMVVLSSFDPLRREVARSTLEELLRDGRIHPARIEEVVRRQREELDGRLEEQGEQLALRAGVHGLDSALTQLLGRLSLSQVGGQSLEQHALETSRLAGLVAEELQLNTELARRAGLLHDIGRVVSHQVPGNHAQAGAHEAKRYGESQEVVDAIAGHHDEAVATSLAVVLQLADGLSRSRPGARDAGLEQAIRRLANMEEIAKRYSGVEDAWVVQSGNELRVVVDFAEVSAQESVVLSQEIGQRIRTELALPSDDIRVTVLRPARVTEVGGL